MKVVYWNNIPAPYMVDRFNALARRKDVEIEAWFTQRTEPGRSWSVVETDWLFDYQYLGTETLGATARATRLLRDRRPDVLFCLYEKAEYAATALQARAAGTPVVMHALKTFPTWRRRSLSREVAKRLLFPRASQFYVPGPDSAAYVAHYGVHKEKITVLPEPVDVERFSAAREERSSPEEGGCTFLYVGRLWRGKGLDNLFDAYQAVAARAPGVSLVLAGDGVDEARYRARASSLSRVRFAGFLEGDRLPQLYANADVLVFPTLGDPYGHVVQEAMASKLPVISTTSAGDISERVRHRESGLVVAPADTRALTNAMLSLATDPATCRSMGEAGYERIRSRTNDWWAGQIASLTRRLAA